MPPPDERRAATQRRGIVFFAVTTWIVVIVAGAGSEADDSLLGVDNLDVVWMIIFATAIILSVIFIFIVHPFSREWIEPETRKRRFGFWVLLACVLGLMIWRPSFLDNIADNAETQPVGEVAAPQLEPLPQEPAADTVAQLTDLLLLAAVIVMIGGVWFIMSRRTADTLGDDHESASALEIDLVHALDQAARELDASGDSRTAVLRSYAVLETVLASHGFTRAKSETPTEHLRRALQNLRIDAAPVVQLGGLYEIARFSDRPISKLQQDNAARALRRAQSSLATLP